MMAGWTALATDAPIVSLGRADHLDCDALHDTLGKIYIVNAST